MDAVGLFTLALSTSAALERANPIILVLPLLSALIGKKVRAFAKVGEVRVYKYCSLLNQS